MSTHRFVARASALLLAFLLPSLAAAQDRSAELLAQVRRAIGGESLEKLASLSIGGTYRRTFGEREMSGDLELALQLPDKFLRSETFGPDPTSPMRRFSGFNGAEPIESTTGGGPNMVVRFGPGPGPDGREPTPEEMAQRRLRAAQRDFGRLVAALLAGSTPAFPLEYRYAGDAQSADGKAEVLEVTGPDGFAARLFVDPQTHVPLMLAFRDVMPRMQMVRAGAGDARPSREEIEKRMREMQAAGPPPQVDVQLFLADYRKVNGVLLPQTVRRAVEGTTVEEWQLTDIKVNPSFKADKFQKK